MSIAQQWKEEGIQKGKLEGKQEGKLEGMHEASLANAKKMIDDGISPDKVQQYTDLSAEEIGKLAHGCSDTACTIKH